MHNVLIKYVFKTLDNYAFYIPFRSAISQALANDDVVGPVSLRTHLVQAGVPVYAFDKEFFDIINRAIKQVEAKDSALNCDINLILKELSFNSYA